MFFHPLRAIPGPKAAKVTVWWRVWVEAFKGDSWVRVLEGAHGVYGRFFRKNFS